MSQSPSHGHGGQAHGTAKQYVIGLILSLILTAIPFAAVMYGAEVSLAVKSIIILLCLCAQILVQMVFFLHMNGSSQQIWNTVSGVYIVFIVVFFVVGTLWIFEHLNHNMLMGH